MRVVSSLLAITAVIGASACSSGAADAPPATGPADYLAAVDELLGPPSRLAAVTADRLSGRGSGAAEVESLAVAARREQDEFAALVLEAEELRTQRDGLLEGYGDVLAVMDPLVVAHAGDDDAALVAPAREFYAALQALPASVPPPGAE